MKKVPIGAPIDVNNVTHGALKDIELFQKDLNRSRNSQVINYTWQKPSENSPSFYKPIDPETKTNKYELKNTLDLMATYSSKNYPHINKQNEWQAAPSAPPSFLPYPQKRRVVALSTMSQYMENMNKVFPGSSMF